MDNKIFQITSRLYNFKIWKRRNRVRFFRYLSMRRKDREVTNIIEILQIIEKAKVLHLALFDADYMNCTDRCRYMVYDFAICQEHIGRS